MWDIRQYGAVGDGKTVDTAALQAAIDACGTAGGGRVLLSQGEYLTSTIRLRSGVELHFADAARLIGAPDKEAYAGPVDEPKNRWLHALIVGEDLHDIAITGHGTIDGNKVRDPQGEEKMRGPHTVLLRRCKNVTLQDTTLRHSGNYAFLFYACEGVNVLNARFEGGWDGVHCRDLDGHWNKQIRISGCQFHTGDDSIAGSGMEDCLIEDCVINSSCNGVRLIGPARRWTLTRCKFIGPGEFPHITGNRYNMLAGLNLQPSAWGSRPGPLEDIRVTDVTMENVLCAFHIVVRPGNTADRLLFERVKATLAGAGQAASSVESWGDKTFSDIVFRDVEIECNGGGGEEEAQMAVAKPGLDARRLPAWGFYARNVKQLTLDRVRLTALKPDKRPAILVENVDQMRLQPPAST